MLKIGGERRTKVNAAVLGTVQCKTTSAAFCLLPKGTAAVPGILDKQPENKRATATAVFNMVGWLGGR